MLSAASPENPEVEVDPGLLDELVPHVYERAAMVEVPLAVVSVQVRYQGLAVLDTQFPQALLPLVQVIQNLGHEARLMVVDYTLFGGMYPLLTPVTMQGA